MWALFQLVSLICAEIGGRRRAGSVARLGGFSHRIDASVHVSAGVSSDISGEVN